MNRLKLSLLILAGLSSFGFDSPARVVSPALTQRSVMARGNSGARAENSTGIYWPLIVKLRNPEQPLPGYISVIHRRGPFVLAYVPEDRIGDLDALGNISRAEGGLICTPSLDRARSFCGFPEVESGAGFPEAYTGRGVVVGFCDIGFDPNHPAFAAPSGGESRVRSLVSYGITPGSVVRLGSPEEISGWSTDNSDEWHGTHVGGILAGSYAGNPYYGIAREAEIVATTSPLHSALLLAGMEDVIAYGRSQGKPAVINMSVGSTTGPHDGTSLFCQYLRLLSEDAVICISAGNDAGRPARLTGTFPTDGATAGLACVSSRSWVANDVDGYMDVWSADDGVFGLNIVLQKEGEYTILHRIPCPAITPESPEIHFVAASSEDILDYIGADRQNSIVSEVLAEYFEGYISVTTEINPENGRFNALVRYRVIAHKDSDGKPLLVCNPGIEAVGRKGQSADIYCSESLIATEFRPRPAGFIRTADGYINDFITGDGVIGVGAMCSRQSYGMLNGETYDSGYPEGWIASFSSFSSGDRMPKLPDIVAPGAYVISPISTPYVEAHPAYRNTASAVENIDGRNYYWYSTCGTSMSTPFTAGVAALWLQADPTLTPSEVKEIMLQTADRPVNDPDSPRWGKGVLNAREGLRTVLARAGVSDVALDRERLLEILPQDNGFWRLELPGGQILRTEIYSPAGTLLMREESRSESVDIDCSRWRGELLILRVTTSGGVETARILPR